jgi:hypothetical protein
VPFFLEQEFHLLNQAFELWNEAVAATPEELTDSRREEGQFSGQVDQVRSFCNRSASVIEKIDVLRRAAACIPSTILLLTDTAARRI